MNEYEHSHNFKLIIAYDGTHYSGWQIQPNGVSIQEKLHHALKIILKQDVHVVGSGRTDAGVHAIGQAAHFIYSSALDLRRFNNSLNALLPPDIRIRSSEEVPLNFHARYSAISKTYHYHLHFDRVMDPFHRLYRLHVFDKIDLGLLNDAAQQFVGTHDFTSFANEAHAGVAAHDPIRNLMRLDIFPQDGGVRLEFQADGFLYKMVRNIVGTLLEISSGKRDIKDIPIIFDSKDRRKAGQAAAPQGLFLVKVEYP